MLSDEDLMDTVGPNLDLKNSNCSEKFEKKI
jgi:hypothetical protein